MNFTLKAEAGNDFHTVSKKAKSIAADRGVVVEFDFNGISCLVNQSTELEWLYRDYSNAWTMEWKTVGPDCVREYDDSTKEEFITREAKRAEQRRKETEEMEARDNAQKRKVMSQIKGVSFLILPGKEADYAEFIEKNSQDGYSKAALHYAQSWAKIMQIKISEGRTEIADIADECQKDLGYLDITGFQYGCAVSALSHLWAFGEELREWHNGKYGVSKDKKGVVNPAILTLKS